MKKIFIILIITPLLFACSSNSQKEEELLKKENELLKRELEVEKKEKKKLTKDLEQKTNKISKEKILKSTISELRKLLNDYGVSFQIDNDGNFSFDMGSASAGRLSGNLRDVTLSIKYQPERPGCADICPPMEIIHFKCINGKKCVEDPSFPEISSYHYGDIPFVDLEVGKRTYKLLNKIKKNL